MSDAVAESVRLRVLDRVDDPLHPDQERFGERCVAAPEGRVLGGVAEGRPFDRADFQLVETRLDDCRQVAERGAAVAGALLLIGVGRRAGGDGLERGGAVHCTADGSRAA